MIFRAPSYNSEIHENSANPNLSSSAQPAFSRVVVTGLGITTALGRGWNENETGFRHGANGFKEVSLFSTQGQRCHIAAEVDLPKELSAYQFGSPDQRWWSRWNQRADRASRLLLLSVREALESSGWNTPESIPIVLATTSGGMSMGERYLETSLRAPQDRVKQAAKVVQYQPQRQALDMAETLGSSGPQWIISNACASGSNAIGMAWEWVRSGKYSKVWTGGYDSLAKMTFAGFDSLQALSPQRCRPLDANRNGLGLGEGSAVLALESLESALHRGANILGEIVGYAACHDTHHLTQPHPEGDAAKLSMTNACQRAGLQAEQIDYVNAHGTGTALNDSAEANAISRWIGQRSKPLLVSSTKSSVGHLLGAAGAVEAVVTLMALKGQWAPPTGSLENPDPLCHSFSTPNQACDADLEYALSNSFGFGGANATLIMRRWKGDAQS